jgi:hypothetical protein
MTTTTVYVIGKCPVTGCKNRRRQVIVDAPVKQRGVYTWTDWQIPAPAPYGQVHAGLSKRSDKHRLGFFPLPSGYLATHRHAYDVAWFTAVSDAGWICTEHDRFMVTVEVEGIVNYEKPCNAKCKGATGPNCECVCGGEGHGSNYGGLS